MRELPVSVIIPAYNEAKTIGKCLNSLKAQTDLPQEIIVVDDGSTDQTAALIKKISQNYQRVKLLTQNHSGPGKGRNLAATKAKGKILVFVDADMEFSPDFLVTLVRPVLNQKAKGSWSGEEYVSNWDQVLARCWNYNQGRSTSKMTGSFGQKRIFRAVLKSEFDRVGGFDHIGYTDDWTLVNKLGYQPKPTRAKFFHANPDTLSEVFSQAYWIGKRQYKLGKLGTVITLVKVNPVFSLLLGIIKSITFREPQFVVFKLVFNWGITRGAWEQLVRSKHY